MVDRLHQQGPRLLAQFAEARFRDRSVLDFPRVALMPDHARLHALLASEPRELVRLERVGPIPPWIADQQRLLLPVIAQEAVDVEIVERGAAIYIPVALGHSQSVQ